MAAATARAARTIQTKRFAGRNLLIIKLIGVLLFSYEINRERTADTPRPAFPASPIRGKELQGDSLNSPLTCRNGGNANAAPGSQGEHRWGKAQAAIYARARWEA